MVQRLDLTSLTGPEVEEHTEAATDVPMQIGLVSISSLAAKVSFRGDLTARPRWAGRTLSWPLDMANFENVPVQLTGFEMENSTMPWRVFVSEVGQNIKGQLVGVALSFLCNSGILSGASGVLGALSSGVASAALDDRFAMQRAQQKQERSIEGVGNGMVEGGAASGMGIYHGFTGLHWPGDQAPLPPQGYRALGNVVVPDAEQPGSKEVLCVREDQCSKTGIFDSPIWKFEPPIMQGGLNVQRLKTYYPETWRCSCWQVDNPAGTFLANCSLSKPSNQAALSELGVPCK
ncbi:TPA: hypothetical protein ACH3X3_005122 [Trebouxia sp. C0006]